jgi:starch synthase (maltosyl-transferring)
MLQLPLGDLLVDTSHGINMHDLITDNSYLWYDEWNFVELHPALPFHLFHIKK